MYKTSRFIRETIGRLANFVISNWYYNKNFRSVYHINCDNKKLKNKNVVDLVTVAFNNEIVIKQQIRLLKKYMIDPYTYTVADNSPDPDKQEKIRKICEENKAGYIKLPKNPYTGIYPSISHGSTLNWLLKHYILKRKANYFGFIDHDIFPVKPTGVIKIFQEKEVYGLIHLKFHNNKKRWYLWPGFCFFRIDFAQNNKLNFMPIMKKDLDTGGGNWDNVFSKISKDKILFSNCEKTNVNINESEVLSIENIDNWIHTSNASLYYAASKDKDSLVDLLLNKY